MPLDELLSPNLKSPNARGIVERQRLFGWGESVVEMVSADLRREFLEQLVQELLPAVPWGHHVEIVKKVKVPAARLWYHQATSRLS